MRVTDKTKAINDHLAREIIAHFRDSHADSQPNIEDFNQFLGGYLESVAEGIQQHNGIISAETGHH